MSLATLRCPQPQMSSRRRRNTILIIDDDHDQRRVLATRLERQGFVTLGAATGGEGLAAARENEPDVVVLDVRLPDTDGFSICTRLADDAATCTIPVILLSGMERPDIIRRARASGGHYFVRKPYDPNALLVLINSAISETRDGEGG